MKRITLDINGKKVTAYRVAQGERAFKDEATEYTEKKFRTVAEHLNEMYQEAAQELYMKQQSFLHAHEARVKKYRAMVERGEITEDDYRGWLRGQVFQSEQWAEKREQLARQMVNVDEQAQKIINEGKIDIFAEAANHIGYDTERNVRADVGFGVYNREAVVRLIRDNPNMLPMPKIDKAKDYAWYNDIISKAVIKGIMQGEDLHGIMVNVAIETGEKSLSAIKRNCRTAYHGAQYAGVQIAQEQDKALGIEVRKEWQCMFLPNSRDAHADLDGTVVNIDEPFPSALGDIMYPGDPSGIPANIYNCHCRSRTVYVKYPDSSRSNAWRNDMTYEKWKAMKEAKARG